MSTERVLPEKNDLPPPYYQISHDYMRRYKRKSDCVLISLIVSGITMMLFGFIIITIDIPLDTDVNRWDVKRPFSRLFFTDRTVLLISMDGFRHDYIEMAKSRLGANSLLNFDRLLANGVRAMESINAYPTITLPNHRTLVTGLYPENHGVIGNNLLDKSWPNETFNMDDQESLNHAPWLTNWSEPIWVTLQKHGGYAGSVLWPLTDQFVGKDLPFQYVSQFTLLNNYGHRYAYDQRIRDILWWLKNPKFHLNLILAYFDEPDETGHEYGPNSKEVAEMVQSLDKTLGTLLDGIEKLGLTDKVDIILTADHGMTETSNSRLIGLDDYVDSSLYTYTQLSTMGFLYPKPGMFELVYRRLKNAHPKLEVYRREEVPAYLKFNVSHSRMPPLVLIAKPKWKIVKNASFPYAKVSGDHGYVTNFSEMHAFFIASGPAFKIGETVPAIHSVDVYALMCALLNIPPNPNNGSLERISSILKSEVSSQLFREYRWSSVWKWISVNLQTMLLMSLICVLFVIILLFFVMIMLHHKSTNLSSPGSNNDDVSKDFSDFNI
ncbi:unnamed protein product [Trichobilharzia szidati]|nr:unnamed protein product [Trichobilharzia szidati]